MHSVKSFSEHTFLGMATSDLFNSSSYKNSAYKGKWHTVLVVPTQTALRGLGGLAIQIIIAPVGCLYHSCQALRYRISSLPAREREALCRDHLKAAGKDLLAMISIVGIVALPIIADIVALEIMVIGAFTFGAMHTVIGTYLYGTQKDHDELLKRLYYRNERGMDDVPETPLIEIAQDFAKNILTQITEIQKLTPDNPLPYEEKPTLTYTLQAIEERRCDIITAGNWEAVDSYRSELISNFEKLNAIKEYLPLKASFNWMSNEVQEAFTNQGELPLNVTPVKPLDVYSLSAIAFKKILGSNVLYPSNYHPRSVEDKGSIADSLADVNIFARRKVSSWSHTLLQPLRFLGRVAGLLATGGIIAPLGVLYHAGCVATYGIKAVQGGATAYVNWEKIKAHAGALFKDLCITSFTLPTLIISAILIKASLATNIALSIGEIGAITLINGFSIAGALEPTIGTLFYSGHDNVIPWNKCIWLKNQFGIAANEGSLLSYNSNIDRKTVSNLQDQFLDAKWRSGWEYLFVEISHLQDALRDANKEPLNGALFIKDQKSFFPNSFVIDYPKIIEAVRENFKEDDTIENVKREEWIKNFEELVTGIENVRSFIESCYEATHPNTKFNMHLCPYDRETVINNFAATVAQIHATTWEIACQMAYNDLNKIYEDIPFEKYPSLEFRAIREMICARNKKCWEVLGFDAQPISKGDVEKAFRKLSMKVHSDKVSDEWKAEADVLFNYLKAASDTAKSGCS